MATIKSGNAIITTNKDGTGTTTITNPGGGSISTTRNSDGSRTTTTTSRNGQTLSSYTYGGSSGSGSNGSSGSGSGAKVSIASGGQVGTTRDITDALASGTYDPGDYTRQAAAIPAGAYTNASGKAAYNNANLQQGFTAPNGTYYPDVTKVTYYTADGTQAIGFLKDGVTYRDPTGITPIATGSTITLNGQEYIKTATGGMLYSDFLRDQANNYAGVSLPAGASKTTYIDADGNARTGYYINDHVYTDPLGVGTIPYGSIVTAGDGSKWVKGAGSDVSYPLAYWNAIHGISGWGNLNQSVYGSDYGQWTDLVNSVNEKYGASQTGAGSGTANTGGTAAAGNLYTQALQSQQANTGTSAAMQQLQDQLAQVDSLLEQALSYNDTTYAAQLEQMKAKLQQQIEALNRQYQSLNRQLYIDYMNSRKNLPQALAAQGYTGGLTESGLLGLETGYQGQLSENERARLTGISDLEAGGLNNELELQIAQAQAAQEAQQNAYNNRAAIYTQMLNQRNYEDEQAREAENLAYTRAWNEQQAALQQSQWEQQFALQQAQQQLQQQQYAQQQAANNVYGYSANGGTYTIGTPEGLAFINSAAPGATKTGGDGSQWTKNADGSVSIRTSDGVYTVAGSGSGNSFQTGLSSAQQMLNQGYGASYIHGMLAAQGLSTDMIDLIFTQLGL